MKKMTLTMVALAAGMVAGAAIARNAKPPKAEPTMQKVLDALASLKPKPIETLDPAEARKQPNAADAVEKVLLDAGQGTAPEPGVTMKTQTVQGKGGSFPVHIFTPEGAGPFPVVVYYHGGGFVIADTKVYEASIRALAKGAEAIVVSPNYRLAPEHTFPTQIDDAFATYQWAIQNAGSFNGDATRVAVAGESAGGNLATVVSMMARDRKVQLPLHQLLVYPVVDNDMNNASYKKNANAKPLNKAMMGWFFKHYGADPKSPYALPLTAASLEGLPPATVITAEIDPLMTEGKAYADRLQKEGVAVNYRHYTGVTHEFFGMGAVVPKAWEAQQFAAGELAKAFNARR